MGLSLVTGQLYSCVRDKGVSRGLVSQAQDCKRYLGIVSAGYYWWYCRRTEVKERGSFECYD